MGKIFLAYEKKVDYLSHYWQSHQREIKKLTRYTITELDDIKLELETIRQTAYAMDREENELGVTCIACPIFDSFGQWNTLSQFQCLFIDSINLVQMLFTRNQEDG